MTQHRNPLIPLALFACACGSGADDGPEGTLALKLSAPEGTACVEEIATNLKNGRERRRTFELTPGTEQILEFRSAPAGDIRLTARVTDSYAEDGCTGNDMYEAEPLKVRLRPGERASVRQHFLARGDLDIDGTFEDDIYENAECDEPVNFALGADASASTNGWGGGTRKADLTDGSPGYCDTWARGLAFTGGPSRWAGEDCGWRQVTLDLGAVREFNAALFYHHGDYHIPATYTLEGSMDGSSWFAINDTSTVRHDLETGGAGCWTAKPTEHLFDAVSARYVRYNMNNCDMMFPNSDSHGWLYEAQIWGCPTE